MDIIQINEAKEVVVFKWLFAQTDVILSLANLIAIIVVRDRCLNCLFNALADDVIKDSGSIIRGTSLWTNCSIIISAIDVETCLKHVH